jgi:2-deoxy-D-gluconate 3-dehydrogenase
LAVITGASSGIGQAIALAYAQTGARTALTSRSVERLTKTAEQIQAWGGEAGMYQSDVRFPADVRELAAKVIDQQGPPTILVNSAGFPLTKLALSVTEDDWDLVLDTGLKGMFFVCQAFAGAMRDQGYGKIINLSSTYASSVLPGKSVYAIAKAGVTQLTRALAVEWASWGIRVNALAPTLTDTPTRRSVLEGERVTAIVSRIPLGRYANTEDLIGAAVFLAGSASDFITGQTLYVDGGWSAAR